MVGLLLYLVDIYLCQHLVCLCVYIIIAFLFPIVKVAIGAVFICPYNMSVSSLSLTLLSLLSLLLPVMAQLFF